jgi:hypothetical protein
MYLFGTGPEGPELATIRSLAVGCSVVPPRHSLSCRAKGMVRNNIAVILLIFSRATSGFVLVM